MGDMDAYRDVFLAESTDYVQQIIDGLLALEREPSDLEPVEVVFRGAHSLKGMSAAMGYERSANLTHAMEGLMARVRAGELAVDSSIIDVMLTAVDLMRDLIDDESCGNSAVDATAMIALLGSMTPAALRQDGGGNGIAPSQAIQPTGRQDRTGGSDPAPAAGLDADLAEDERAYLVRVTLDESCVLKAVRAYMVIKRMSHMGRVIETTPSARDIEDENFDCQFGILLATVSSGDAIREAVMHVSEVIAVQLDEIEAGPERHAGDVGPGALPASLRQGRALPKLSETQTVRVAIGHLDSLVDLVGELVILRSRLDRLVQATGDAALGEVMDDMHRISVELQYEVMQTRMVPVGNIFNRFPRMVRDLAVDLGKKVDFEISGLDIELDRTVLDEIGDPIVHLLRNSIDHGIEPSDARLVLGKEATGVIRLTAARERDHVSIVVSDDGRGIDTERVWTKACELGLAVNERREEYSESDILLFTCVPGFSTVEATTKVSGRGVGMDAVKGKIEHLGGTLQISSRPGKGTDFILRLPLTLAIIKALLVESRGQAFALALSAVNEVFAAEEVEVETIDGAPVVVLRDGEVVPLVRLDSILYGQDAATPLEPRSHVVLIATVGSEQRALQVGSLLGRQEIVIKPLSRVLKDARGFSGATVLGDGRVLLILDPRTMFLQTEARK